MANEFKGTVVQKFDIRQISDNFSVQDILLSQEVLGRNGPYTKHAIFQFRNASLLKNINVGMVVIVSFEPESRQGKQGALWFTSLNAWKIDISGQNQDRKELTNQQAPPSPIAPVDYPDDDSLPF